MVEKLEKIISQSQNIVFFGGAGVSTESGIPDFRSVDGLYHQKYDYPPEPITLKGTTDIIPLGQTAPGFVVPKLVVPIKGFT